MTSWLPWMMTGGQMKQNDIDWALYRAQQLIYNGSDMAARQLVTNLIETLQSEKNSGSQND